ncbi:glycosyltransferase [Coleofasciculus sp. LEGE 07081]|uniref:glycosyltransferase n=1 Tax=Coleofasciculus sp. LEGE 07081 TaxID=2777967 RepID=UPI00187F3690|nr:glycosyltransferase [Coleofasciculus sp. LEGE 07081]
MKVLRFIADLMNNQKFTQSVFVITGMHRSGTSLVASLLQSSGVDIGERLMPPAQGNIKGYFENLDWVEFHEEVLSAQGINRSGWTVEKHIEVPEQFLERAKFLVQANSSKRLWGWKDPRTTLFLDFWENLIPTAFFLLLYRTPWEVIDSLYRRGNTGDEVFHSNPNFAIKIWLNYNQEILKFYEQFPERCLLIDIQSITYDPNVLVQAIKDKFRISLNYPAADIYEASLLKTQPLNSHRSALLRHYFPEVWKFYHELKAKALTPDKLSGSSDPEPLQLPSYEAWVLQDWLDVRKLERETSKLQAQIEQTQAELVQSHKQEEQTQAELTQLQSQLEHTQAELTQSQSQLEHTQAELTQSQSQLEHTQAELTQSQSQLEHTQAELTQSQSQLEHTQAELTHLWLTIAAMESSKFWQLRAIWFRFRRAFGIAEDVSLLPRQLFSRAKYFYAVLRVKGFRYGLAKLSEKSFQRLKWEAQQVEVLPEVPQSENINYQKWLNKNYPKQTDLGKMARRVGIVRYKPTISIIMPVFNPPEHFLREAIESVLNQVYPYWELCIADDASTKPYVQSVLKDYEAKDTRIKLFFREENGHISRASNSALEIATGEFVVLLDHDDLLTPDALYEAVLLLNKHPNADMIYSDEDKLLEDGKLGEPFFKPDWCHDSFLSRMYTCHLGIYRRSLINEIGGFRDGYEGSQDYDLVLRLTEKTNHIFHIPKILYHWRVHSDSTASRLISKSYATDAARKAILDALQRRGESGRVVTVAGGYHIVRYAIKDFKLVSIIIPTKNLGNLLEKCLNSIFVKTKYPNYEVLLIDNGSTEAKAREVIEQWKIREPDRFRCEVLDIPFNFPKLNNYAVKRSKGDYLLFLNNDTEVLTPDWIDAMVEQAQRPCIGAVGALLLYPDNTIQHAGVVVGVGGVAGHSHKHYPSNSSGYFNRIQTVNNYSAVTAACLMCRREIFETVGGFEEELSVAFNDVDFCLKIIKKGYRNIYLPHVVLYHYESKSRGYEDTPEKQARFIKEIDYMQKKWKKFIEHDSCYSPNLTRDREDYGINI